MPVLKTSLKWSPDGCRVVEIPAGEHAELPARAQEIAVQLGILELDGSNSGQDAATQPEPQPEPQPEKTDKKTKK